MKTLATLLLLVGSLSWGAGTATALPGQYTFVKPGTGAVWTFTWTGGKVPVYVSGGTLVTTTSRTGVQILDSNVALTLTRQGVQILDYPSPLSVSLVDQPAITVRSSGDGSVFHIGGTNGGSLTAITSTPTLMSSGEVSEALHVKVGNSGKVVYNYEAFTRSDTGTWVNSTGARSVTLVVSIAGALGAGTGATLYVTTSCSNFSGASLDNYYHGVQVGSVINASGVYTFEPLGCYTKIRIQDNNQPTVYVGSVYRAF